MALVPYTNTGENNIHIGGKVIVPGETREVDETLVPGYGQALEPDADADRNPLDDETEALLAILAGKVADVVAALPTLSVAQLDALENLETEAEKPRKGILEAIDARRLELAEEGVQ